MESGASAGMREVAIQSRSACGGGGRRTVGHADGMGQKDEPRDGCSRCCGNAVGRLETGIARGGSAGQACVYSRPGGGFSELRFFSMACFIASCCLLK